jgi:cell wall-associated NlpC family hydrolase
MARLTSACILAAATIASGCASTGAVPRPFPMPGRGAAAAPRPTPTAAATGDLYALVGTALSLRGTPYRNGGSDPKGFDCSGFTQFVFGQHGVALPRGVGEQFRAGSAVGASDIEAGDLLFFATTDPGASHVAIAIGGDEFVHAPSSTGVVRVEHLGASYWTQRYIGARRVVRGQ